MYVFLIALELELKSWALLVRSSIFGFKETLRIKMFVWWVGTYIDILEVRQYRYYNNQMKSQIMIKNFLLIVQVLNRWTSRRNSSLSLWESWSPQSVGSIRGQNQLATRDEVRVDVVRGTGRWVGPLSPCLLLSSPLCFFLMIHCQVFVISPRLARLPDSSHSGSFYSHYFFNEFNNVNSTYEVLKQTIYIYLWLGTRSEQIKSLSFWIV